jgi:anti-anti-sigma factor
MKLPASDSGRSDDVRTNFVTITFKAGVLTIAPMSPRLGEHEAVSISADLRPAMARCMKRLRVVVIDMAEVTMMTSYGMAMCVEIRNTADSLGVRTVVCGLRPELEDMFRMLKVSRLFTITHNAAELASAVAA